MDRTIKITGIGEIAVPPEKICVALTIKGLDKLYGEALKKEDKNMELLENATVSSGIKKDNIITSNYSIVERYEYLQNKKEFLGFEVSQTVKIEFDFDKKVLTNLINNISKIIKDGPHLHVTFKADEKKVHKKLLELAVENAKNEAEIISKAAGVKLGKIISISHNFDQIEVVYGGSNMNFEGASLKAASARSLNNINVDNIKFSANINVEWEIEN